MKHKCGGRWMKVTLVELGDGERMDRCRELVGEAGVSWESDRERGENVD